jgi:vancomycin resistance protein YoaR
MQAPRPSFITLLVLWLTRTAYASAFFAVILLSVGVAAGSFFELSYRGRIYPGVHAWGLDLSGQKPEEAALRLGEAFNYPQLQAFSFKDGDRVWSTTPAELGVTFDLPATVTAAYAVGRSGNIFLDWITQFEAWYQGHQVSPIVVYNESTALLYLDNVAQIIFKPTIEASLIANGTQVQTTPGQVGRQLDVVATTATLRAHLLALEGGEIPLSFIETPPLILDASAQAEAAEAILRQPLVLDIAERLPDDPGPWTIDTETLGSMLSIHRVAESSSAAHYEVGLDPQALRIFLEPLAQQLERKPQNARFIFNDDTKQLELIQSAIHARELDFDATIELINQQLAQNNHTVSLVFQTSAPPVADDATAAQLGITELVSQQSTLFRGSSAERINNIKVAAARFHGLLIPPQAVFSFDDNLGDVSLDSGFAEALIIYGGRTIRGVGGGVCQVSTTVFRAAYFGGFPIIERNSHAYRVGYYERGDPGQWSGPGLDATVFAPIVDFKFQNDTPYWLLMEVYVAPNAGRITWKFYSTSDGRTVTVSPANVRNVVPHPEPLYEEDPEVPPGLENIKQVDFAADGADVVITRTITRDGVQINPNEAPLRTHYQPWRAVYHYGPGTEGVPGVSTPVPTATPNPTPTQ